MEGIEIQVWVESKKSRWRELLEVWYEFWLYEPMNSGIPGVLEGENRKKLELLLEDVMVYDDAPLIVAWDTRVKKVVGFIITLAEYQSGCSENPLQTTDKAFSDYSKYKFDNKTAAKLKTLGDFLENLMQKADIYKCFGVQKILMIEGITVLQEYTKRGIARTMVAKLLMAAKEGGFELIVSESTSAYTRKLQIDSFNFEMVYELDFESSYVCFPDMPKSIQNTHKTVAILAKRV